MSLKQGSFRSMQFNMKNLDQLSLSEMEELLSSSRKVIWQTEDNEAKYAWVAAVLKAQRYAKLSKREKGVVRRFPQKVTSTSRAQLTRLIGQWMEDRQIVRRTAPRPEFAVRYTKEDIVLLAATDAAHEDLSGPALCHILGREFEIFGKPEYKRLAGISVSHLYNLRNSVVVATSVSGSIPRKAGRPPLASAANRTRRASRDFYAWTPCIKGRRMARGASITSTQWTR